MKVTYTPDPEHDCPQTTSQYGYDFVAGQPVEVTDEKHLAKFGGNPFFKVEAPDAPPAGGSDPAPAGQYEARHRGFGRYSVMEGDKEVVEGLDKAGAEAFNALPDADKAAYVDTAIKPAAE